MKKFIVTGAVLLASLTLSAQEEKETTKAEASREGAYVSLGIGPTFEAHRDRFSDKLVLANRGSFGAGYQASLHGGYLFNKWLGVDLGFNYLKSQEQNITTDNGLVVDAHSQSYGLALSGIFTPTKHLYVRAGLASKIGGETKVKGSLDRTLELPAALFNPQAPAGMMADVPADVDFQRTSKGKFSIGFIGAIGAKVMLDENWGIFLEGEYLNIRVKGDKSTLNNFTATLAGETYTAEKVAGLIQKLGAANPEAAKEFGALQTAKEIKDDSKRPYSSVGVNFGFMYKF